MAYSDPQHQREAQAKWLAAHPDYSKQQWAKHKEKRYAKIKEYQKTEAYKQNMKRRRTNKSVFLNRYKVAASCFDCGYNEASEALQCDHVVGTKRGIIGQFKDKSWKNFLEELAKCVVRCANCHAIKTKREQNAF
jgi:hypothetical protein